MKKLWKLAKSKGKEKQEAINLQLKLREKLKNSKKLLMVALEKNDKLERDMVRIREDFNKYLK